MGAGVGLGEDLKGFPGGVAGKGSEVRRGAPEQTLLHSQTFLLRELVPLSLPVSYVPAFLFLAIHPSEIGTQLP